MMSISMVGNRRLPGVFCGEEVAVIGVYGDIRRLAGEAGGGEVEVGIDKTYLLSRAEQTRAYVEGRRLFAE